MSNFNMAKLRTDFAIEEYDEYQGLTDYFGKKDSDAAEADKWSLWGSVIGGIAGFVLGGFNPYTAYLGYQLGKQAKYFAPEEIGDSEEYFAENEIFSGGKFGAGAMQNQVDQAIFAEEQEDLSEMITKFLYFKGELPPEKRS